MVTLNFSLLVVVVLVSVVVVLVAVGLLAASWSSVNGLAGVFLVPVVVFLVSVAVLLVAVAVFLVLVSDSVASEIVYGIVAA